MFNMAHKEDSAGAMSIMRMWRLGFAWGILVCFLAAFLIFVIFLKSNSPEMMFLILGLFGLGIVCGVMVVLLNSKEKKLKGLAPHSSAFGTAMGITLIVFIIMLALAFYAIFVAAMSGLR